jgi:hypothetical protein
MHVGYSSGQRMRWAFQSVTFIVVPLLLSITARSQNIFDKLPGSSAVPTAVPPSPSSPGSAATQPATSQPASGDESSHHIPHAQQPVPDAAALGQGNTFVSNHYDIEIKAAKTAAQKKAMVQKLLDAADAQSGANLFAVLSRAKSIAIEAEDVAGADAAMDELESSFIVDSPRLRLEAYVLLARSVATDDDGRRLLSDISTVLPQAILQERFDIAKSEADLALRVAKKFKNAAMEKQAAFDERWARTAEEGHTALEKSFATLAGKPDDPDANLRVGQYRCFLKSDWHGGLPMLKLSSDSALKNLATQEMNNPAAPEARITLADAWWDYAAKLPDVQKSVTQKHAAWWYESGYDSVSGVLRLVVQKRIEEGDPMRDGQSLPPSKSSVNSITIEANITGGSELHITPTGIYWVEHGLDKPGKSNGGNLPTVVNGKEWLPKWANPAQASGDDTSEPYPLDIGPAEFTYHVTAIAETRGDNHLASRGPVTLEKHGKGLILTFADTQPSSAMWYSVKLTRDTMTEHPIRFAGKWVQKVGGTTYTFSADGSVTSSLGDNNAGTWGANAEGTGIEVKWRNGGLVEIYAIYPNLGWNKTGYVNGIRQAQHHMTPP